MERVPSRIESTDVVHRLERTRSRIEAIDVVRGVIIILMALNHVHDFFGNFAANPADLATTTPALFFTR